MTGVRLLLAEDEPLASMALRAQLEALGHEVVAAARDADEAVALGRCFPVDLAIFDMRMPGRSGLDAATDLFRHSLVPAVLLTGFSSADLPDPVPQPPIFARLTKPVGLDDIRTAITTALDRFGRWADENDAEARRQDSLDERSLIARALRQEAAPSRQAARDLLEQAHSMGAPPVDVARLRLEEEP